MIRILELFFAFLQIGALAIGGGYATIPLIQAVVLEKGWLSLQEFSDIITISQMTPGPIAVNTSTFVGLRYGGFLGAVAATIGCVITGVILCMVLSKFFMKFSSSPYVKETLMTLRSSSTGLILSAAVTIVLSALIPADGEISISAIVLCGLSLFLLRKYKMNSIYVIMLGGILGILLYT